LVREDLVLYRAFFVSLLAPLGSFQTLDHDAIMHWSLTLTNARSGFLRGDQGELLIEEKVRKKRQLAKNPDCGAPG
jgi:hypothetical protein